ncbi:MAG: hypothetical protein QOJ64_3736 [Acidobacteriota bacterium]|jgi:GT2 family glycosyltransferase/glycosyltransferase involved in cell wall biosynthesis|nr:hypothetical protein [Acidobacteriota bacterium]
MIDLADCRFCIDEPKPVFAAHGEVQFSGWSFDVSSSGCLQVRLNIAGKTYQCESGRPRPDVGAAFPQFPQASFSGFFMRGWMPPGCQPVHLELCADDFHWCRVWSGTICAEMAPLLGSVDLPLVDVVDENPVTVLGWALQPQEPIELLTMHIGGTSAKCSYGMPRPDVAAAFPNLPQNDRGGFSCKIDFPFEKGRLYLQAHLRSGAVVLGQFGNYLSVRNGPASTFLRSLDEQRASILRFPTFEHPKVSIVIPVFNETELTLGCLKSVQKNTVGLAYEVIVVDDDSSADTARSLQQVRGLRVVTNKTNLGFLLSCNKAAVAARGEYLLFLNNDTEVTADWLAALLRVFGRRMDAGLVGAKLVYPNGRLQEAGSITWKDASAANFGHGNDAENPSYNYLREVDYCSGACVLIPKSLFERLGGFDPLFTPAYYEDVDLAFKAREVGLKTYYQPAAVVIHHRGLSYGPYAESGGKTLQSINQARFQAKWTDVLSRHLPNETDVARGATQHGPQFRALVIDTRVPCPDQDAGSMRRMDLLFILQEIGFQITFIPQNKLRISPYSERMQEHGIECLHPPFLPPFDTFFAERGAEFDVVILSHAAVANEMLPFCRKHIPNTPVIFDTVDLHFLRGLREATLTQNQAKRKQASEMEALELELALASDAVVVVSTEEMKILRDRLPGHRVALISMVHEVQPEIPPYGLRRDFLFIGGFEHSPNVDAVLWFCSEIMPMVLKQVPGVKLHVIGSKIPKDILLLANEYIVIHGHVENIEPFLKSCLLSIAPLRYGAGVKGKISLSMSWGLPVVSTTVGAEGMHLEHGKNILVADTPATFAEQIVRLHADPGLWRRLSQKGLTNIEKHFSRAVATHNTRELLLELRVLPSISIAPEQGANGQSMPEGDTLGLLSTKTCLA